MAAPQTGEAGSEAPETLEAFHNGGSEAEAEVREKDDEKEAAAEEEALKREQEELREARRHQQRLDFLMQQTELFSRHFWQIKRSSQPSEVPLGGEKLDEEEEQVGSSSSEVKQPPAEETPEDDAELRKRSFEGCSRPAISKHQKLNDPRERED